MPSNRTPPISLRTLILRYTAFAVIATIANLATQRLVFLLGREDMVFVAALIAGTFVGLVIKYFLDKRWIFYDQSSDLQSHGRKLSLYTLMGVATTAVFWGSETAFWVIWQSDLMRDVGAVLGLAFGYWLKFQLDRRFVFPDSAWGPST